MNFTFTQGGSPVCPTGSNLTWASPIGQCGAGFVSVQDQVDWPVGGGVVEVPLVD